MNPFEQYRQMSINTMTKGELLILLFDEAIKKLNQSKLLMEHNDFINANVRLEKTKDIINHLIVTLDDKYSISKELRDMYMFFNSEIIKASSYKSSTYIDEVLPLMKELRDTWEEADKIARAGKGA